jgi:glycosyltransferase involved in cell wall biosynthesis
MPEKVSILLSSFNGGPYLSEQLDSLVTQGYPELEINVRDDGSTDESRLILQRYAAHCPNMHATFGKRLGIAGSFFQLLRRSATGEGRYFAFCDQDDVWYPDKIERAVATLSRAAPDAPALYCSRLEYVDQDLNHLGMSRILRRAPGFGNALVENCATGCTQVLNRSARDLIIERLPDYAVWHDWWCYLVVAAFGRVLFDPEPGLKYRLHAANDTGAGVSLRDELGRRLRRLRHSGSRFLQSHRQALEFQRLYAGLLDEQKRSILERFVGGRNSLPTRFRLAASPAVYRQTRMDDFLLRLFILAGRY